MRVKHLNTSTLKALACLLIIKVAIATQDQSTNQTGCHSKDAILDCLDEVKPNVTLNVRWKVKNIITNKFQTIAYMRNGRIRLVKNYSLLEGRLALLSNGSLKITSLRPDDETSYRCIATFGFELQETMINLQVKCNGEFSKISREVCVEEQALLDCPAKDRTNPRNFKVLKWHKKNMSASTTEWLLVAAMNESSARVVDEGFHLHGNGSLVLPRGREEGKDIYKCDVSKIDRGQRERHQVEVQNTKCRSTGGHVKTSMGRVTMTTVAPLRGSEVAMETSTVAASVSETSAPTTEAESAVPTTQSTMVCEGVLQDPIGSFQSPNFPSAYPANSHCKWTISVPQDYAAINITLARVNLEHEDDCQNDYIAIYDELENQIGCRFCGTHKSPIEFQVRGNSAVVVFQSDASVNKSGFKATYKAAMNVGNIFP